MFKNIIIGAAGHIDHGKSSLVQALTGKEVDRLASEKERGISIELSFLQLENNLTKKNELNLAVIDVPGHKKFVNKMLAAAGGIDLALIVVAADEGVMPQTKEHLAILDLLAAKEAVIAVNKVDLIDDPEWLELVEADIREQFASTFAADAELIRVSAKNNSGVEKLKSLLIKKSASIPKTDKNKLPYFPVDRVFSLKGQGTIVTGTLLQGKLENEVEMEVYPEQKELRINSMENHKNKLKKIGAGSRVGLNIKELSKSEIKTGDIIAAKNSLISTCFFETDLVLLESLKHSLKNGDRVHFHTAAAERTAVVHIYDRDELYPGEKAFVKFKLNKNLALFYKQKFVIRGFSPLKTIGGGQILDIDPPPRRKTKKGEINNHLSRLKKANLEQAVAEFILAEKNLVHTLKNLIKKTAVKKNRIMEIVDRLDQKNKIIELEPEKTYLHQTNYLKLKKEILEIIAAYHQKNHLYFGIKKEELRSRLNYNLNKNQLSAIIEILKEDKLIKEKENLISKFGRKIKLNKKEIEIKNEILAELKEKLFKPPTRAKLIEKYEAEELLDYLEAQNYLLRLTKDLYFHADIFIKIKSVLKNYFKNEEKLRLAKFRDLIDSSRRYALPLLEKSDQLKLTKRKGELRSAGYKLWE